MVAEVSTLGLSVKYEGRVQLCFDAVEALIPASEIYLYGSYAEGRVLPNSPVSLLFLIGEGCSNRELKTLSWEVEDLVYRISDEAFPVDIKVFPKSIYVRWAAEGGESLLIEQSKKDLRQVCWIDK